MTSHLMKRLRATKFKFTKARIRQVVAKGKLSSTLAINIKFKRASLTRKIICRMKSLLLKMTNCRSENNHFNKIKSLRRISNLKGLLLNQFLDLKTSQKLASLIERQTRTAILKKSRFTLSPIANLFLVDQMASLVIKR